MCGIRLSGPFNSPLLPEGRHWGQLAQALRRGQTGLFREAGQRLWGRKRGSGIAKAPKASDPPWALLRGNFGAEGAPSVIFKAHFMYTPQNVAGSPPLSTPHHCSQHWALICSKPASYTGFLSAGVV